MQYVITPSAIPTLPVEGQSARFPVSRIFCVGRNYAEHAREMGHDPNREPPFFFMKPASAIVTDGKDFPYPAQTTDVHHEMELVSRSERAALTFRSRRRSSTCTAMPWAWT